MAGRRNRPEHKAKLAKKAANAPRVYQPPPDKRPPAKPTLDVGEIVSLMRKDYESKLAEGQRRPGAEKIDDAMFKIVEMALGSVESKQKRGKLKINVDQNDLKSQARPMLDTLAEGLKEAFLAKWIPQIIGAVQGAVAGAGTGTESRSESESESESAPGPATLAEAVTTALGPSADKTSFDVVDAAGLAALLLHRKKKSDDKK